MAVARANPLAAGLYRVEVAPELAQVFGRWRRANAERVHVIGLEPSEEGARVVFAVYKPPGAFPFGQLGHPEVAEVVVGAVADWIDVIGFLANPLGAAERAIGEAAAHFVADVSKPELKGLRDALIISRANVATIRAILEAVKNGTAPNPAAALGQAAAMAKQTIEVLVTAGGAIPIDFPRNLVNAALQKLHELEAEIKAAPGKALHAVSQFASDVVKKAAPVLVPGQIGIWGLGIVALGGFLAWEQGKRSELTDKMMLAGAAVAVLGGGIAGSNLFNLFEELAT
jgi:hypothetical protein